MQRFYKSYPCKDISKPVSLALSINFGYIPCTQRDKIKQKPTSTVMPSCIEGTKHLPVSSF